MVFYGDRINFDCDEEREWFINKYGEKFYEEVLFRKIRRTSSEKKKYEILKETEIEIDGRKFYRIRALVNIPEHDVKIGDIGGFIENEKSLCSYTKEYGKESTCWLGEDAVLFAEAKVEHNAYIHGKAKIIGKSRISRNSNIRGDAVIDNSEISYSDIYGNAIVKDSQVHGAKVFDNAKITDKCRIFSDAKIYGNAVVKNTEVRNKVKIYESATVENSYISCTSTYGSIKIYGKAQVYSDAEVCGHGEIHGNARVFCDRLDGGYDIFRAPYSNYGYTEMTDTDRRIIQEALNEYHAEHHVPFVRPSGREFAGWWQGPGSW